PLACSSHICMANTDFSTLSLHDALPIWPQVIAALVFHQARTIAILGRHFGDSRLLAAFVNLCRNRVSLAGNGERRQSRFGIGHLDRKSTRLNSSHSQISYAVFCLKKKLT